MQTEPQADTPTTDGAAPSLTDDERARRHAELIELLDVMRPAVEADGGQLHLLGAEYDTGVVRVALSGACGSCSVSSMTLEGGIARILSQRLDWFTELVGEVWDSTPEW